MKFVDELVTEEVFHLSILPVAVQELRLVTAVGLTRNLFGAVPSVPLRRIDKWDIFCLVPASIRVNFVDTERFGLRPVSAFNRFLLF